MPVHPIRRVVTGNDPDGRSKVVWDGPAPNAHENPPGTGRGWTDLWVWDQTPAPLSGETDDGNKPYDFPGAATGGHFRVVHMKKRVEGYDPAKDHEAVAPHESRKREVGQTWERGGQNSYSSAMHMTESLDYGILLFGQRNMTLDDRTLTMKPGDIAVQLGDWHLWSAPDSDCRMAFVLIGGDFEALGPAGGHVTEQHHQSSLPLWEGARGRAVPPEGVKPVRRIICVNDEAGRGTCIGDGPSPDVRIDPARPGFAATRVWVADSTPAKLKGIRETLDMPHTIEPPKNGSLCRVLTVPPDSGWQGKIGVRDVQAYFQSMGSPGASTYSAQSPHPYMQKTETLDFCMVVEGEVTLVLDTQEVALRAGDTAVLRGANHAWSNRGNQPAVVAISSHDGTW